MHRTQLTVTSHLSFLLKTACNPQAMAWHGATYRHPHSSDAALGIWKASSELLHCSCWLQDRCCKLYSVQKHMCHSSSPRTHNSCMTASQREQYTTHVIVGRPRAVLATTKHKSMYQSVYMQQAVTGLLHIHEMWYTHNSTHHSNCYRRVDGCIPL